MGDLFIDTGMLAALSGVAFDKVEQALLPAIRSIAPSPPTLESGRAWMRAAWNAGAAAIGAENTYRVWSAYYALMAVSGDEGAAAMSAALGHWYVERTREQN